MKTLTCLILLGVFGSCLSKQSYTGYQVIKVFATEIEDLLFLQKEEVPTKLVLWDFTKGDEDWPASITFHAHPDYAIDIRNKLFDMGLYFKVLVHDLQEVIDKETADNVKAQSKPDDEWFQSYHTFDEMMAWVDDEVVACGSRCSTISIGSSYEGRDLKVVKMIGEPNECEQKPTIWIDSGIHAREWIAHTTGMYLLDRLIFEYDSDPFVKHMLDTYDWYILPVVNPDGYVYTWDEDRLWRKTRQPSESSMCVGVDPNRNYDFMWMTIAASDQPCSDTYAGPEPHSEPETRAQSDFMLTLNGTWELFLTVHTYGQLWMTPWGYTQEEPDDYVEMARVGQAAVQTIFETHGKVYQVGNAASILYQSSGTSRDWAKGVPRIPYVYTLELRSESSFVLPPTEIRPTGQEIWAALKTTIERIQDVRPGHCISK